MEPGLALAPAREQRKWRLNPLADALIKAGFAPPRARPWCDNKTRHKSQGAADAQLRSLKKRGIVYGEETLNSYRCYTCGFWHVGHAPWLAA